MLHQGVSAIVDRNQKNVQQVENGNREMVTIIETVCADGTSIAPLVIFQAKRRVLEWGKNNPGNARLAHYIVFHLNSVDKFNEASQFQRTVGPTRSSEAYGWSFIFIQCLRLETNPTNVAFLFLTGIILIAPIDSVALQNNIRLSLSVYLRIRLMRSNPVMSESSVLCLQAGKHWLTASALMESQSQSSISWNTIIQPDTEHLNHQPSYLHLRSAGFGR